MPKIEMTNAIGTKLRELRLRHNVKSKDVAEYIGKSTAYLTKVERGHIKRIGKDIFKDMIVFITGSVSGYEQFMEEFLSSTPSEMIDEKIWMYNFDTIERKIPIPNSLLEFIKSKLENLGIATADLITYINQNEDLGPSFFTDHGIDPISICPNTWYPYTEFRDNEEKQALFIKLSLPIEILDDLFLGVKDTCSYIVIFASIYHILKFENKDSLLSDYDKEKLKENATKILHQHKFYSISDRSKFISQSHTQEEFDNLLSEFDKKNMEYITSILSKIHFLSDYDVKYTNEKLKGVVDNITADPSFALSFMSVPLSPIIKMSVTKRKEFLEHVNQLIHEFENVDEKEKLIELY